MTTMMHSHMPDSWLSVSSDLNRNTLAGILSGTTSTIPIRHIGVKLGNSTVNANPGWTSHLPGKEGLLCRVGHVHVISNFNVSPNRIAGDRARFTQKTGSSLSSKFLTSWNTVVSFGSPIEHPDFLSSPTSMPWRDIKMKVDSIEARTRALIAEKSCEVDATSSKVHSLEKNAKSLQKSNKGLGKENRPLERDKRSLENRLRMLNPQLKSHRVACRTEMEATVDKFQSLADRRLAEIGVPTAEPARAVPLDLNSGTSTAPSAGEVGSRGLREQLADTERQLSLSTTKIKTLEEQTKELKERLVEAHRAHLETQIVTQSIDDLKEEKASLNESIKKKQNKILEMGMEIRDFSDRQYQGQLLERLQNELEKARVLMSENVELRDNPEVLEAEIGSASENEVSDELNLRVSGEDLLNKLNEMSRSSLKRKVEHDLFHDSGSNKRMRPSTEVDYSSFEDPSLKGITQYNSITHNEVLRIAGTGGLINPMHFDVTKTGTIALTKLGLERANLFATFKSQPDLIRRWTEKKATEISNKVRKLMDKSGFFTCGHIALLELKKGLQDGGEMDPGSLVDALNEMSARTLHMREQLAEYISEFQIGLEAEWTEENTRKLKPFLISLYSTYDDRQLGFNTKFLLADMRIGAPRDRMLQHIQRIANSYHSLVCVSEYVRMESRIPGHYLVPTAPWESVAGDGDEEFRTESRE